jgi:hypothetical protein
MHTKPMSEGEGTFRPTTPEPEIECRKCKKIGGVSSRCWDSSCGGYEDYKLTCTCGHSWWEEGPDS